MSVVAKLSWYSKTGKYEMLQTCPYIHMDIYETVFHAAYDYTIVLETDGLTKKIISLAWIYNSKKSFPTNPYGRALWRILWMLCRKLHFDNEMFHGVCFVLWDWLCGIPGFCCFFIIYMYSLYIYFYYIYILYYEGNAKLSLVDKLCRAPLFCRMDTHS